MDDILSGLQNFIGTKEGLESIEAISKMFNNNSEEQDVSNNSSSEENTDITTGDNNFLGDLLGNFDIGSLLSMQSLFSKNGENDNNTALLQAIKPFLSDDRQKKVDTVIKLMKIAKLWPVIKESGFLDKLL